ncbi:amino acid permease [Pedomonas mirosovicensis]|uniref:amino acid permease n=1 Tax=Pedomonas mirosovicensis TaxID=2908641 RepID=UPI0021678A48|nr:amino acid permease [Pedomonas mirosovicensis]MCH8686541.1 amino acid permease [Pedomonas mirosovicensis]
MTMGTAPNTSASPQTEAPRKLGRWMATCLVLGNMIGSGVFLLPASLAPLGWNSVFGWLFTIAGAVFLAAVFCRLSRAMSAEGGPYAYTRAAFGPLAAFLVAWSYWMSLWIGNAAIAVAATSYLTTLIPPLGDVPGLAAVSTCLLIWLLTLVNARGARLVGGVQVITSLLKLVPLAVVVGLAALALASGTAAPLPLEISSLSAPQITAAATLTLWAFLGLESATIPAGKIKDPARTIPFATMAGTVLTGLVYLFTCSAIVLLMPGEEIAGSNAPFAAFVTRYWGAGPAVLVAVFAAISCIGALNGWILVQAEMPYAMAKSGAFPKWFAVQSSRGVPVRALVATSLLMTVGVLLNYSRSLADVFQFLLLLATATTLFMYLACALAALRLSAKRQLPRKPLMEAVGMLAALYALWTIYGAGKETVAWGVALLLAGLPCYALMRRPKRPLLQRDPA